MWFRDELGQGGYRGGGRRETRQRVSGEVRSGGCRRWRVRLLRRVRGKLEEVELERRRKLVHEFSGLQQ